MKKKLLSVLLCVTMAFTLYVPVTFAMSGSETHDAGEYFEIFNCCDCEDQEYEANWYARSSNSSVVSVSSASPSDYEIYCHAVGGGAATVTCTCSTCGDTSTFTIYVNEDTPEPQSIGLYLEQKSLYMDVGDTKQIDAYYDPGSSVSLSWSSSNSSVASVSGSSGTGTIYARSAGTATITVRDGISGESDSCTVKVTGQEDSFTLKLSTPENTSYNVGAYATLYTEATLVNNNTGAVKSAEGVTYQWYKGSSSSSCNTAISGATSRSMTPSTATAGTTYYKCKGVYSVGSVHTEAWTGAVRVEVVGTSNSYYLQISADSSTLRYGNETDLTTTVYKNGSVDTSDYVTVNWSVSSSSSYAKLNKGSTSNSNGRHYATLHYSYYTSSDRTCTVDVYAYIGGKKYTASRNITLIGTGGSTSTYRVELSANQTTLAAGQSSTLTASVYQNGSLIKSTNPNVIWSIRNGSDVVRLASTSTYAQAGYTTNTLYANQAYTSARTVTVVASMTVGGSTYTASKDFTVQSVSGSHDIECYGMSFGNMGIISEITSKYGSNISYVQFDALSSSVGKLYANAGTGTTYGNAVVSTDRYYLSGTVNPLSQVYFVPAADCASSISFNYRAYNTGGSYVNTGTININVRKHTVSSYFADVKAAWCSDAIDYMRNRSLVTGITDSTFGPSSTMTKGMLITILYRAAGSPAITNYNCPFTDLNPTYYYYDACLWAYYNDYASGYTASTFGVNNAISREEIAEILWRTKGRPTTTTTLYSYADYSSISSYALNGMCWATGIGIIRGNTDNKLHPKDNATRAEVSVMLHRYFTEC